MTSNYGQNEMRRFDDERDRDAMRRDPSDSNKTSGGMGCKILAGCFGIIFLFMLCLGGAGLFLYRSYQSVDPVCREHLNLLGQQKHKEAYDALHPDYQREMPFEIFDALSEARRIKLGELIDITYNNHSSSSNNGAAVANIVYSVTYQNGLATVTFMLEAVDDVWKITDVQFDSAALNPAAYCPTCKAKLEPGATSCSSCGREISPLDWFIEMEIPDGETENDETDGDVNESPANKVEPEPVF